MAVIPEKAAVLRTLSVLAVLVAFGLSGCGGDSAQPDDAPSDVGGPTASTAATSSGSGAGSTAGQGAGDDDASGTTGDDANTSGGADDANSGVFTEEPPPIQLFTDSTSEVVVSKPTAKIARNQRQLNALLKSQASSASDRPTVPVTFSEQRQVVAVFMPSSPKGSQITVAGVSSNGTTTKVNVLMLTCKGKVSSKARPTAWVETKRLPGRETIIVVEKQPSSGC